MISLPDLAFNFGRKGTDFKSVPGNRLSLPDLAYKLRAGRALLIGAGQAAVYEWRNNDAVRRAVFEAGEEGRQGFRRYLAATSEIPFHLLVDLADEEYRQDSIPHVARRDRQALLQRRAARLFKETGYCYYKVTGRESAGRRDDRVFLSALANPGVVRQWTALLDEAGTPLAGICSLPLFSGQLLKAIACRDDGCRVLVSMQSVSGLRQTCFDNGDILFSRLVQMPGAERTSFAELIRDEVGKVLRYLDNRRPGSAGEPVHVHFLFAGDLLLELKPVLKQQDSVIHHFCDLNGLAGKDALREPASSPYGDEYYMQQLFRLRPGNHYAGAAERRWFFLGRLRLGIAAAGMTVLLGSAGWGALNVYGGMVSYFAGNAAAEEAHRYAAEYELAGKRLPETPVDASGLKTAVTVAGSLARRRTSPAPMAAALGRSLRGFPSIRLSRLSWTVTGDPDTAFAATTDRTGAPVEPAESGARTLYQAALVNGRIEPFQGNFREAMDTVHRFAEDLRGREPVHGVDIVALPLDISSGADLQGNTRSLQHRAEFTLKVVLENGRET